MISAWCFATRRQPSPGRTRRTFFLNDKFEGPYVHTLEKERGWWFSSGTAANRKYGASGMPPISASQAIGGGSQAIQHRSDGTTTLATQVDLRGNALDIDAGSVRIEYGGFFGGVGSDGDYALHERAVLRLSGSTPQHEEHRTRDRLRIVRTRAP